MGPPVTCVLSSPNTSGVAHGLLSEALHKPGGGSLARAGGLPELAYGEGQGHELHREEVSNDKSEQSHYSFWTSRPSRVIARTPGNESWQAAGTGHVDRRDVAARQRPHDPNVDAAGAGRGGNRLRHTLQRILHPQVPTRPRPARRRKHAEEARRRRPTAQARADCVPPHRPPAWRRDGLSRPEHPRQRSDRLHHAQPGVSRPRARCDGRKDERQSLGHGERRGRPLSSNGAAVGSHRDRAGTARPSLSSGDAFSASPSSYPPSAPPSSRWSQRRRRHECDAGARA